MTLFLGVSYNQPMLPPHATWDFNATTVVNSSLILYPPTSVFVNKNNSWCIATEDGGQIPASIGGVSSTSRVYGGFSIFVAGNNDVYSYDDAKKQINIWSTNTASTQAVMYTSGRCEGLFVDTNHTLYCTPNGIHHVVAKSLDDPANTLKVVAGTGCYGSTTTMLGYPSGIFVHLNFSLFVADSYNHRIQHFSPGQQSATTVAGSGAPGTMTLLYPRGVVLDGNGYLFIVDANNQRIIGSGPDGFRCVAACTNVSGSASNQLSSPMSMSFDTDGNMWVADYGNRRIQKFLLIISLYGKLHQLS